MKRMKTFFKYFIIILVLYIVSDFAIAGILTTTYQTKSVNMHGIDRSVATIELTEATATVTNGKVKGRIKNNSEEVLTGKLIKVDCISKNGTNMGTKYIEIPDVEPGESYEFETQFNFDRVDNFDISLVDEKDEEVQKARNFELFKFKWDDIKLNQTDWFILFFAVAMVVPFI